MKQQNSNPIKDQAFSSLSADHAYDRTYFEVFIIIINHNTDYGNIDGNINVDPDIKIN